MIRVLVASLMIAGVTMAMIPAAEAGPRQRVLIIEEPDGTIIYEIHRLPRRGFVARDFDGFFEDGRPLRPPGTVRGARLDDEAIWIDEPPELVPSIAPRQRQTKRSARRKPTSAHDNAVAAIQLPVPRPRTGAASAAPEPDRAPEIAAAEEAAKQLRLERADGLVAVPPVERVPVPVLPEASRAAPDPYGAI